jgi:predicted  nucleic acid-binding Zn-ribbon protein
MMEIPGLIQLLDLQEIDLAIDRLLHQRQSLPELAAYQEASARLEKLDSEYDRVKTDLRGLELETDKAEGELELIEIKLKESETRLFAGGMSGRETEQKRLEVQALRGQQEAMEERVLANLERLEPLREAASSLQQQRQALTAEIERLNSIIGAAWKEIDAKVARREADKGEIARPISEPLVTLYEQLRRTKEGVAVGRLEGGVCGGCHLALSLPEQAEAAEWDPPRCIHCMRILVI